MDTLSDIRSVCYQGIEGSYSHTIAKRILPHCRLLHGFLTFDEALEAVERRDFDLALIPIENNIGGRVAEIHHLLFNTTLKIVAEYFLRIDHCLVAPPGADLAGITHAHSHPQALLQCREFLRSHRLHAVAELDTAVAARDISADSVAGHAAIASRDCARTYNLRVIHDRISDHATNLTRFIAMRRGESADASVSVDLPSASARAPAGARVHPVSALLFQLRSVPAALYKALGGFATSGINLLKLESYVDPLGFDIAQFYAEIAADIYDPAHAHVWDELTYFAEWVRVIGVFEQNRTPIMPKED